MDSVFVGDVLEPPRLVGQFHPNPTPPTLPLQDHALVFNSIEQGLANSDPGAKPTPHLVL